MYDLATYLYTIEDYMDVQGNPDGTCTVSSKVLYDLLKDYETTAKEVEDLQQKLDEIKHVIND